MANNHLLRRPTNIDKNHWYYEEPRGIEIYIKTPEMEKTETMKISWGKLRAALERKDRKL